jgi:hypothetical protein
VEWKTSVTGPHFFEDEDRHAVSITSARYVDILWNILTPELNRRGTKLSTIWIQQDGATAHTERATMVIIREMFPEDVISLRSEIPWPARSPDLSAPDYFLWGYFKAKFCTTRPRTIDDLKIVIRKQISAI